jgi:phosphoglycolate phosphatase-like HAD superfamily hydrolase
MNTREDLIAFKPRYEFLICIDSDGTVFDSMNIKHIKAFIPAAWTTWDFGTAAGELKKIMENVNLYSETRGINRYLGLYLAFEKLMAVTGLKFFDLEPLREFNEQSNALSGSALEKWIEDNPHPFLKQVLVWSLEADRLFEENIRGQLPFPNVENTVKLMGEKADIMVVSSASGKGLEKDFEFSGLTRYMAFIGGQELGSKKQQLFLASSGKYSFKKVLMIGDAPGDMEAASGVGASFFPIIPGKEVESWQKLKEESLERFFAGSYKGEYEDRLIEEFNLRLK